MRHLLIIAALLACTACHEGYIVLGDSITAEHSYDPQTGTGADSWAYQIIQYGEDNPDVGVPEFIIHAYPGIQLVNFVLPEWFSWINSLDQRRAALIALGTNDLGNTVPVEEFEIALQAMVDESHIQGLDAVCMLVFNFDHLGYDSRPYREVQTLVCDHVIDIPLDLRGSTDGVHPTQVGHHAMAAAVLHALDPL